MPALLAAFLIGIIAGLRSIVAPAIVVWAVGLGWVPVAGTSAAWLAGPVVRWALTFGAIVELVGDKLPMTPSRKLAGPFAARIVSGALCGALLGMRGGSTALGAMAGVAGAVVGTLGGYDVRMRLAGALGRDLPAALIEDAVAVVGGLWLVAAMPLL